MLNGLTPNLGEYLERQYNMFQSWITCDQVSYITVSSRLNLDSSEPDLGFSTRLKVGPRFANIWLTLLQFIKKICLVGLI